VGEIWTNLVLDEDPLTNSRRVFHFDQQTEQVTIEDQQDVTQLLERNEYLSSVDPSIAEWARSRKEFIHVSGVPLNLLMDLKKKRVKLSGTREETKQFRAWLAAHPQFTVARGNL